MSETPTGDYKYISPMNFDNFLLNSAIAKQYGEVLILLSDKQHALIHTAASEYIANGDKDLLIERFETIKAFQTVYDYINKQIYDLRNDKIDGNFY